MSAFTPLPKLRTIWEGVDEYNGGLQRLKDFEFEAKWIAIDQIQVAGNVLTYDEAHEFYVDLVCARLAEVTQKQKRTHPFQVETQAVLTMQIGEDGIEVSPSAYGELLDWLRCALGIEKYTGNPDEWEY